MAPIELTAFETAQKVKSGELSAMEVLEAALERIAAVDGQPGTLDYGELTDEDRERSTLSSPSLPKRPSSRPKQWMRR